MLAALEYPTVVLTVIAGVCIVYWVFVFLGALDVNLLGGGHDAGGLLEGGVKGAAEGSVKGLLEGGGEAAAKSVGATAEGLLEARRRPRAPLTVTVSVHAAVAWLFCLLAMELLGELLPGSPTLRALLGTGVLAASLVLAWPVAKLVVAPLAPLFTHRRAQSHRDLVGRVCTITTGSVDARFGQAELTDGGAGLRLHVRCDTEGTLSRGDSALIVAWDEERESFVVEPMKGILEGDRRS